jgi:hypothetical protein
MVREMGAKIVFVEEACRDGQCGVRATSPLRVRGMHHIPMCNEESLCWRRHIVTMTLIKRGRF